MLALGAASPFVASATSAATDTQLELLGSLRCRLTTMLPSVAFAVPVLVTVTTPKTLRRVGPVAPRVAVTVHWMVAGSSGRFRLCDAGLLTSVQAVSLALQSSPLQLVRVMLAWPAGAGVLPAAKAAATLHSAIAAQ